MSLFFKSGFRSKSLSLLILLCSYSFAFGCDSKMADAYLIKNLDSQNTVCEKAVDKPSSIASITKLFAATALVDLGIDLEQHYKVKPVKGINAGRLFVNKLYSGNELLHLSLMSSSNLAIKTLANQLDESIVVARMNSMVKEIGLTDTSFVEVTGLMAENKSTASDIAKFLIYLKNNNEKYQAIFRYSSSNSLDIPFNKKVHHFRHTLNEINQNIVDSVVAKTGWTNAAGRCLAMIYSHNGHEIGRAHV